ncbi:MAG: sulfite exporter TauE/SafE family protein [Acidobacteriaceae bacterium]|nr:sulfite exporter TauE/SafE family protein [Acidobacteriaceae bacterium]
MEVLLGFVIALAISLTGVGAGSMTTPLLILLLRVPPATAVGTALMFGAIVKIASVPVYVFRRQVNIRVLRLLLAGGVPGVLLGAVLLDSLKRAAYSNVLYGLLGFLIVSTALFRLYRVFRPEPDSANRDRPRLLLSLALPIGAEVGFSSAGAGALGSLLLLSFTRLTTAEIVGTDLCFGLGLSLVGSVVQFGAGNYDSALLTKLVIGGLAGALTGSLLAGRIAQRPLRVALLLVLIALGCQLAFHGGLPPAQIHAMLHAPTR